MTDVPSTPTVFVMGMHRSGTSLAASMLIELGCWAGADDELLRAATDNPRGFFERTDFMNFAEGVLALAGGSWRQPSDPARIRSVMESRLAEGARPLDGLLLQAPQDRPAVLKDPRLCLLWDALSGIAPQPRMVVLVLRHPVEVAQSLLARNGMPLPEGLLLWEAYLRSALQSIGDEEVILLHHRDMTGGGAASRQALAGVCDVLGLAASDDAIERAAGLADDDLVHHAATRDGESELMTDSQRRLWSALAQFRHGAVLRRSDLESVVASALGAAGRP